MERELGHVFPALAQWRKTDGDDVDAIVEIAAESTDAHIGREVAVGRGDHADIDAFGDIRTHASHFTFLQRAQQFDLERRGQLAYLIEEQCTSIGFLEEARFVGGCSGERAAYVAEQFGLEQRFRYGAAVDGDERFLAARTAIVNEARDELFAGSTLARDEHRRRMPGDFAREVDGTEQRGASPNDGTAAPHARELLLEALDLGAQLLAFRRLPNAQDELFSAERLLDVVVGAALHRGDRRVGVAVGAHGDHEAAAVLGFVPLEKLQAAHRRHAEVAEDEIGVGAGERV
ncbi:MAG TPA: hypothetical protein VGM39_06195 [Kofleriaceae bacterium]